MPYCGKRFWTRQIPTSCMPTLLIFIHIEHICAFFSATIDARYLIFCHKLVGIWWVQKRFPQYGVPIWSLWQNIRYLASIVAEKNAHICSMCIKINKVGIQEVGKSDIWSQASYRYGVLWEAILDPSDSCFLFAVLVGFYTHWTYMHIFRRIFLSNYWWQKSDIWSQASYRYPISWEAFFDPSDTSCLPKRGGIISEH
jgi:hypothetical protein